jgi:hypothetical protein
LIGLEAVNTAKIENASDWPFRFDSDLTCEDENRSEFFNDIDVNNNDLKIKSESLTGFEDVKSDEIENSFDW